MALNLTQAAKLVGVSRNTLYAAIRSGRLVCTMAGRPGAASAVTLDALAQAGFSVPASAWPPERSDERSERAERPERLAERPEHSAPSSELSDLHGTLESLQRAVDRLGERVERSDERLERSVERAIERALERVVERLIERRAHEAIPAVTVRPLAEAPTAEPLGKSALLGRLQAMKAEGLSLQTMANRLNNEGVPTLSGKGMWQKGTISNLLAQGAP
jgi:predicted DNA-binding protein (UPF0251 family)